MALLQSLAHPSGRVGHSMALLRAGGGPAHAGGAWRPHKGQQAMQGYLGAGADILGSLSDMHEHGLYRSLTKRQQGMLHRRLLQGGIAELQGSSCKPASLEAECEELKCRTQIEHKGCWMTGF